MVLSQGWFKIDFVIHYQISRLDPAPDRKPDVLVKIPDPDPDPTKRSGADRMRTPTLSVAIAINFELFMFLYIDTHLPTYVEDGLMIQVQAGGVVPGRGPCQWDQVERKIRRLDHGQGIHRL
jgi:hypothetical protein